jgi:hypothetical protein
MPCNTSEYVDQVYNCTLDGYTHMMGDLQFALLIGAMIGAPLYIKYEDPVPPGFAIALVGGALIPTLPGQVSMIAWLVVFIGLVVAVFGAAYKAMIR